MKYLPTIVTVLTLIITAFSGPIQSAISAHPSVAAIIAAVWAILNHLSTPPVSSPVSK